MTDYSPTSVLNRASARIPSKSASSRAMTRYFSSRAIVFSSQAQASSTFSIEAYAQAVL